MSSGAKQLSEDFEQVQKLLKSYPNIRIVKTEGDPPEQYDIEYTIKGYKTEPDGTTNPVNKHEVRISLPFGYPHFPPTAKPITPIFHPDIDPDAIRIADFWQENNSLSELIIHIGQMICGNHYTTEEPFNQSAYEWFEERKSWLPFDILEPRDEDEIPEEPDAGEQPSDEEIDQAITSSSDIDLDILKDDIDFPFDDESEDAEDELSFGIEEDEDELDFGIDLEAGEDEPSFDDLQDEEEDLLDLGADEPEDTVDFEVEESEVEEDTVDFELGEPGEIVSEPETAEQDDLFDLNEEETVKAAENGDAGNEEESAPAEESSGVDITLDDLAGLDEDEEEVDFGLGEEAEDSAGVDLSGLEQFGEEKDAVESEDAEDDILASLSLDEEFTAEDKAEEHDQAIRSLIEQKKIYTAKKALADHPEPDSLPSKKEFDLTISDAVSEAEDLFKSADKHEKKGDFEKAGIMLDLVANVATDFPGLEMARNNIREALMSGGERKPAPAEGEEQEFEDQFIGQEEKEKKPAKKKKKSRARMGFSFKIPTKAVIAVGVLLVVGGIGGSTAYVYMGDDKKIDLARTIVQEAEKQIDLKNFTEAKKQFTAAESTLDEVLFFQSSEKGRILKQINSVRNSSLFREGLKGRVLYGDMYVTVEVAKAIDKFNTQVSFAEKVLKDGKLDQAINAYEKALPYAEKAGFTNEIQQITRTVSDLRVKSALSEAEQAEEKLDWVKAKSAYAKALEYSKTISPPEQQQTIARKMTAATYHYGLQVGVKAMNESQWQTAIGAFSEVKNVFDAHPGAMNESEKIEITQLLIESQLYHYLAEAKEAFENKIWDKAVTIYNEAIGLLRDNFELLGAEGKRNITMIEKTILTTHIAEKQDAIAAAKEDNQLQQTIDLYKDIVNLIENSAFKSDATLARILSDARTKTVEIKDRILVKEREQWLLDNYNKIFRENYPTSRSSEFMNPQVRYIKREDNIMIFNISCTELNQGRKFRLELNYQHDLDTGKWSIYSGNIEEEEG